jgi:hypothetical protein
MALQAGDKLGSFEIVALIGQGGWARSSRLAT